LIFEGAAFDFDDLSEFMSHFELLNSEPSNHQKAADAAITYTRSQQGATARIVNYLTKRF
jgi:hypothetical protein